MSEWITLSQTAGTGNATITISANTYDELQNRVRTLNVATITKKKTVTVRQYSREGETISVSPITLNYGYLGNDIFTITVTTDYNWSISCSPWLTTNIISGSGNGTFTVKADPNAGGDRTGFVSVATRDITVNIVANQNANVQLNLYAMFVYSGASATLFNTKENVYKIRVDGGEWFSPASTSYNFGTEGEHFVDVTFRGDYTNSIPPMLCSGCTNLVRVFIPNGYYEIHRRAFEDCDNLYELSFGDTLYKIGDYAFSRVTKPSSAWTQDSLTNIVFGNGLEEIGEYAFALRPSLNNITFNNRLKTIGHSAFYYCYGLPSIIIPGSVELIDESAFANCTSLTNITLNNGLKYIGCAAFDLCAFENIIIPNSVVRLDYGVSENSIYHGQPSPYGSFRRCRNLKSIVLPESIEGPIAGTFSGCTALSACQLSTNITVIGADTFNVCENLSYVEIPYGVEYIGYSAFQGCKKLQLSIIPDSVKEIGCYAFSSCTALTKCIIGSGVTAFTNSNVSNPNSFGIFGGDIALQNIVCNMQQEPVYKHYTFNNATQEYEPEIIPVENVADTFYRVKSGGTLYHSSGSNYNNWLDTRQYMLGYYGWNENTNIAAFGNIMLDKYNVDITGTGVVQLTIYCNTVWTIYSSISGDDWAIYSQRSGNGNTVITISFPNEPSDVNTRSGYYNILTGTDSDTNRDSVKLYITQQRTIKLYSSFTAYYNVNSSGNCHIVNDENDIYSMVVDGVQYDKNNLTAGTISFTSGGQHIIDYTVEGTLIPNSFFANITSLTRVDTGDVITAILPRAFENSSLNVINFGNNISAINSSAFSGCTNLTNVIIPSAVTALGFKVFANCSSLSSVTLPSALKTIDYSFVGCSSLQSLTFPSGFTGPITGESFSGCTNLSLIYIYAVAEPNTDGNAFEGIGNNGVLHYPSGADYSTWLSDLNTFATGWTGVADL